MRRVESSPASGNRTIWGLVVGFWLVAGIGTISALAAYATGPGQAPTASDEWPHASTLARTPDRPTLVMVVHPRCPCSQASLRELERLMARLQGHIRAHVLVAIPRSAPEGWEAGSLVETARGIPGVEVTIDEGATEADGFGAKTSGQVFFYDAAGELRFAGGITPSRGHEGDTEGRDTILALVLGTGAGVESTASFGCPLGSEAS